MASLKRVSHRDTETQFEMPSNSSIHVFCFSTLALLSLEFGMMSQVTPTSQPVSKKQQQQQQQQRMLKKRKIQSSVKKVTEIYAIRRHITASSMDISLLFS